MPTLYQAEWCPFSAAVRQLLTEHGIEFVSRPVEPWPEDRERMRVETGTTEIPVLVTDEGDIYRGSRAIFAWAMAQDAWDHAESHRERFREHLTPRQLYTVGTLVARAPVPSATRRRRAIY